MAESQEPQQDDVFSSHKATLIATVVAIASVVIPAWFWMDTWFGRELSDDQIREYLADTDSPRKAQHALAQISKQITHGDPAAKQWYPEVLALADHELHELRLTVAWLMGDDTKNDEFHSALLKLLRDQHPMVRRNAALALTKFGDTSGIAEIRGMLRPFRLKSPYAGKVQNRLQAGDAFDINALLVRVEQYDEDEPRDVRAPLPGIVQEQLHLDDAAIEAGAEVTVIRPESVHAMQALLGLYIVGTVEDIELIKPYQRQRKGIEANVVQQAHLTVEEIRRRAAEGVSGQATATATGDSI